MLEKGVTAPAARSKAVVVNPQAAWVDWRTLHCNLHWVYEGGIDEEWKRGPFKSRFVGVWLIRKGSVQVTRNGVTTQAVTGDWVVLMPGKYQQEFAPDSEILSIRCDIGWPDGRQLFDHNTVVVFSGSDYPQLEVKAGAIIRAAHELIPENRVEFAMVKVAFPPFVRVKVALWEWVGELFQSLDREGVLPSRISIRDERVASILHVLDSAPLNEPFKQDALAANVGLGGNRLARLFRQEVGLTPHQYLDKRRAEFARTMLAARAVPIKEVAIDLGFSRLSDFSWWFKGHFGCSPRAFQVNELQRAHL